MGTWRRPDGGLDIRSYLAWQFANFILKLLQKLLFIWKALSNTPRSVSSDIHTP